MPWHAMPRSTSWHSPAATRSARTFAGWRPRAITKPALEMGSKSAVIVCQDADLRLAVNAAVLSAFKTTGQRCVSAGRVLVHRQMLDRFADQFVVQARGLKFGDPFRADVFAGPMINRAGVEKVLQYNELARREGAKILLDGGRLADEVHGRGWFLSPFVYVQEHKPDGADDP